MPRQALHPEGPTPTSCFRDPPQKLRQHPGAWRRQQGLPSPPAGLAAPYVVGSAEPPPPRPHHLPTRAASDPVHTLPPQFCRALPRPNSPLGSRKEKKRWSPSPSQQTHLKFPAAIAPASYWPTLVTWKCLP